jgi:hypothetical protein
MTSVLSRLHDASALEFARLAIVFSCAMSLIAAGRALPF